MNDPLTFFRKRKEDRGREWQIEAGDCSLYFYSKSHLEGSDYVPALPIDETGAYPAYKARIKEAIGQAGGGLMVEARRVDANWTLAITPIDDLEGSDYRPAETVFYLEQGGELAESAIAPGAETGLALPADAHAIVPVDLEAEEHFRSFRAHFSSWFPADFESAMLNLLRRPSLELRLERLERLIDGQHAPQPSRFLGLFKPRQQDTVPGNEKPSNQLTQTHWIWGGLGLASGFLLAVFMVFVLGLAGNRPPETPDQQADIKPAETSQPMGDKPSAAEPAQPQQEPETPKKTEDKPQRNTQSMALVQAEKNLNNTLSNSSLDAVIKLRQAHFSNLDGSQDNPGFEDPDIYWGLLKLPALSALLKAKPQTKALQNQALALATTNQNIVEVYKTVIEKGLLNPSLTDDDTLCLVAYSIEKLDSDGKLGLGNQFHENIPSLDLQACAHPSPEQVAAIIDRLANELAQVSAPPKPAPPAHQPSKRR